MLAIKNSQFSTNISLYLGNAIEDKHIAHSYNGRLVGNCIRAFDWYQFRLTLNDFERP